MFELKQTQNDFLLQYGGSTSAIGLLPCTGHAQGHNHHMHECAHIHSTYTNLMSLRNLTKLMI